MLDTATKKRIDDCRDILVGKLPDPKAQIEQITIALIYKFMGDMDEESIELGGKAKFFTDYKIPNPEFPNDRKKDIVVPFEKYAWHNLFDAKVTATELLSLYSDAIMSMDKNPNIPGLFRNIFKNAYLPYRSPETLKLFLKTIGEFEYTHSEKLGDAFEYLLSVMGSQGDAGQFRTPRHIIDFVVAAVDPSKTDSILDPACGTAGFLISAFKYIRGIGGVHGINDFNGINGRDKACLVSTTTTMNPLTPDERKKIMQNIVGYDISPDMVRLSLVNLYLHGFSDPHIYEYDSLSSEERWNDHFDVILANPPFMSPKGGIRPHKKFSISSNRSEVLFVDYIAEHLNPKGKAGIIVPEGVIFQSGTAYKALRKMLVEKYLYAVVSLPAGVFNPYSGVKTSILLMDKELAKKKDDILFVKIDNDGYGLGAQRNEIKGGQLAEALEVLQEFKDGKFLESKMVHSVAKKEIGKNGDYNLSGERYKSQKIFNSNFPIVELKEVARIISGQSPKGEYYNDEGIGLAFYQGKTEFGERFIGPPSKWTTEITREAFKDDILMSVRAPVGPVNYATEHCCIGRGLAAIKVQEKIKKDFLFYLLKSLENSIKGNGGAVFDSISRNQIEEIKIPLPPLSIQEEIVAEIEGYQKILEGAKAVVENYKPKIDIDPAWEMVELGEVATFKNGINYTKESEGAFVKILGVSDFKNNLYAPSESFNTVQIDTALNDNYKLKKGDIVFVRSNGNQDLIGRCVLIPDLDFAATFSGFTIRLRFNSNEFDSKFYTYLFKSDHLRKKLIDFGTGANIKSLNQTALSKLEIPFPPFSIQKQIVGRIEQEQQLVHGNEELIEIFEQKIKDRIAKVWGGR